LREIIIRRIAPLAAHQGETAGMAALAIFVAAEQKERERATP
jgi:hypothetical protein